MTEAVALVLRHAFGELGLRRVKAYAATGNAASERVLTANGLTVRGVERLGALLDTGRGDRSCSTCWPRSGRPDC